MHTLGDVAVHGIDNDGDLWGRHSVDDGRRGGSGG